MPRNKVINRSNINPLTQWTTSATPETIAQIKLLANAMHVSQGSLVDTAINVFFELFPSPDQVAKQLRRFSHLTDGELDAVMDVITSKKAQRKTGDEPGAQ